jgi:hypothetical protein
MISLFHCDLFPSCRITCMEFIFTQIFHWNFTSLALSLAIQNYPTCTIVTFRKIRCKSNFAQLDVSIQTVNSICKGVQLQTKAQQNETWSAAAWPPCRLSYPSSSFFRHVRLTALSFSHARPRWSFKKFYYFRFFLCLKLRTFEISQHETA